MLAFDEHGWALALPALLAPDAAYTLYSPEASARLDAERWGRQAARFFDCDLAIEPPKHYLAGGYPLRDAAWLHLRERRGAVEHRVRVVTCPIASGPGLAAAARHAAEAMGGAGFEQLLARAVRLWQVGPIAPGAAGRGELLAAAVACSLLLAPVLGPDGSLFGVKGCRSRLERVAR